MIQTLFGPPPPSLRERFQKAVESTRSTLTANVEDLIQGKVEIDPDFQRNLVWSQEKKSGFIESIILNIPLPPLYFNQDKQGNWIVVDGLQRSTTLRDFVTNKFPLKGMKALPWLNGKRFRDLEDIRARIEDKGLLYYLIKPSVHLSVIHDIFNRINTGGTQLQRQEIRFRHCH